MNRELLLTAVAGVLFGAGLVISQMADFNKVLAFLTLAPGWDPALMFVMAGALAVTVPGFALAQRRGQPLFAAAFPSPASSAIDRRLLVGAAIFGLGWGLQGYCPGPAVVAAGLGHWPAVVFLPAMLAGAWVANRL
ncbi:MAG: DUF6691 family protein [Nevskiaceae bacterium]